MYIVIFITAANKEEAVRISEKLVKDKLVACVNIAENIDSVFFWEGKVNRSKEVLLIAKSKKRKLQSIILAVKQLHSYQVPEIIALPMVGGYKPYLEWIDESLRRSV